jgi:serine/threonine protein kinase
MSKADEDDLVQLVFENDEGDELEQQGTNLMGVGPAEIQPEEIELVSCIGSGSFGLVCSGLCRSQPVAVKVLFTPKLFEESEEMRMRGKQNDDKMIDDDHNDEDERTKDVVAENWKKLRSFVTERSLKSSFERCVAVGQHHVADNVALYEPKSVEAFRREVAIMSACHHPQLLLYMGCSSDERAPLMIVTERMDCDLEQFLSTDAVAKRLQLIDRLRIAKDVALGMNWLHRSTPVFVHRDLKPSNILIDRATLAVKICDFGLTQVLEVGADKLSGSSVERGGTPLYCAPEVFSGADYDAKSDVYSFGLVLYQIVTGDEPYDEFDGASVDTLHDAIHYDQVRPELPATLNSNVRKLIAACWSPEPAKRPSFKQIVRILELIVIDVAVADKFGRRFWRKRLSRQERVPWTLFEKLLRSHSLNKWIYRRPTDSVHVDDPIAPPGPDEVASRETDIARKLAPLRILACDSNDMVTLEQFGRVLDCFGPFASPTLTLVDFLARIQAVTSCSWFHGDLPTSPAINRLDDKSLGTFLVRMSSSARGGFTISRKGGSRSLSNSNIAIEAPSSPSSSSSSPSSSSSSSSSSSPSPMTPVTAPSSAKRQRRVAYSTNVQHLRITHAPASDTYTISSRSYPSLVDLISAERKTLQLDLPCGGSPFALLNDDVVLAGYTL